MTVEQKRKRIQKALNTEFVDLDLTQTQRDRLLWRSMHTEDVTHARHAHLRSRRTGGERVKLRTKMSFSLVLVLILFCLSVTALAVGILINGYYERVAQMDASGNLIQWQLEDKISFVEAMREYEFVMNEEDYTLMLDESKAEIDREAAADRIIAERYGDLIRKDVSSWMEQPEDLTDIAPNETIIFTERYMAEHPEGIKTREDYVAYTDALGYYLRDVYYPAYAAETAKHPVSTPLPVGSREDAEQTLRSVMTEVLGWDIPTVDAMVPEIVWDETYQLWVVSGEIGRESMEKVKEPILEADNIQVTESGYRLTILVDTKGNFTTGSTDKDVFVAEHKDDITPVSAVSQSEATDRVKKVIMERFGLQEVDVNALFYDVENAGLGPDQALLNRYVFHTHYILDKENLYGAVINRATGEVTDVFSYQLEDMSPVWKTLFFSAETEQSESWYIRWPSEKKEALLTCLKACGLLAEHSIWTIPDPEESVIDAFVAEICGAKGYPSAINTKLIAKVLLGPEEIWTGADHSLYLELQKKYPLSDASAIANSENRESEITADEAMSIVKEAFCDAWTMDLTIIDNWGVTAQQVHDDDLHQGKVYYRVILSVPVDSEADFYGRSSFDYRIMLDGTLMDAAMEHGCYSPAQEKALLEEQQQYDHELYRMFDRYAQKQGLLTDYESFFHWPLEHQKACADELRPLILEKKNTVAEYADPRLLAFASHVYGIPQEGMISVQEAIDTAGKKLQAAFGFTNAERVSLKPEMLLLDVTVPEHPFYQISYSAEEEWSSALRMGMRPDMYYTVEVDALTGETLNTYSFGREDGQTGIDAWERWY